MITEKIYNRGLDLEDKGGGTPPGLFSEAIINFGIYGFPFVAFLWAVCLGSCNGFFRVGRMRVSRVSVIWRRYSRFYIAIDERRIQWSADQAFVRNGLGVCHLPADSY